jgi:hypothetical protein
LGVADDAQPLYLPDFCRILENNHPAPGIIEKIFAKIADFS